ncbi:MAG: hypothetical protein R3228_08475 [Halioglobus sp.]|nr:hypothetical protein [Halioglobus sp.]
MSVRAVLAYTLALLLTACTGMTSVGRTAGAARPFDVAVGDFVEITTMDRREFAFTITELTPDAIVGEHVSVAYIDIAQLSKREIDPVKTAWNVGLGASSMLLLALSILLLTTPLVVMP